MIAQGSEGTDETTQRVPKPTTHRIVKTIRVLGIIHIINGVILVSVGITILNVLDKRASINTNGAPVWGGICMLSAGVLGILLCHNERRNFVAAITYFNVFTGVVSMISSALFITGLRYYVTCRATSYSYKRDNDGNMRVIGHYNPIYCRQGHNGGPPLYAIVLILAIGEVIVSMGTAFYSVKIHKARCPDFSAFFTSSRQSQVIQTPQQQNQSLLRPQYLIQSSTRDQPPTLPHQAEILTNALGQRFMLVPLADDQHIDLETSYHYTFPLQNPPPQYSEIDDQESNTRFANREQDEDDAISLSPPQYSP